MIQLTYNYHWWHLLYIPYIAFSIPIAFYLGTEFYNWVKKWTEK